MILVIVNWGKRKKIFKDFVVRVLVILLVNYKDKNYVSYGGNVIDGRFGIDFLI